MKKPNYRTLYNEILSKIKDWMQCDLSAFDYKPYLWVHEYEDEMDVAFCDTDQPYLKEMYDFPCFCEMDDNGNYRIVPETIHAVVRKWCLAPMVEETRNYDIPKVFTEENVTELCERFRNSITGEKIKGAPEINIRYAVRNTIFHVASFGEYFFFDDKLYKIDSDPRWKPYHDTFAAQAFFGLNHKLKGYVHAVAYCGIQTPYKDDQGDSIFTGDICQVNDMYHSVTSNDWEGYGFAGDNCMLTLDMALERGPIHRVGTIFYQLSLKEPLKHSWANEVYDMWGQAADIDETLKKAKLTPSFMQEDMEYFIISSLTGEFDWRVIFDAKEGYPVMENEPKRISPDKITHLTSKQIFVFGSNIAGEHHGGAAHIAYKHFGAEWGVGEGLTGKCYALPTMEGEKSFERAVKMFSICAQQNQSLTFLVTAVGCGIAGYTPEQVAPWFKNVTNLPNVYLPESFWNVLDNMEE